MNNKPTRISGLYPKETQADKDFCDSCLVSRDTIKVGEYGSHIVFRSMWAMGIREDRRIERRTAVLDAALEIMECDGIQAVTIATVAKKIGASVGGMYRYFPTKSAIFEALQLRSIDGFERFLERRLQAEYSNPLDGVIAAFDAWPKFREVCPTDYRLLDEFLSSPERSLDDAQAGAVNARLQSILERIAHRLAQAVESGHFSPGDAMARTYVLWAALHGLGHFEKRDHLQPEHLRTEALRAELSSGFFAAWSA